jgi:hypothetical protein
MIHVGTKPDSKARPLMMHACTASLDKLENNPNFWTLLKKLPDLAVEIVKHPNLAGDWECEGEKYTVWGPRECEGVPACPSCGIDDGAPFADPREPYEQSFAYKHRHEKGWKCPDCGETASPKCSMCEEDIRWVTKKLTRMATYPPWDPIEDKDREIFKF